MIPQNRGGEQITFILSRIPKTGKTRIAAAVLTERMQH